MLVLIGEQFNISITVENSGSPVMNDSVTGTVKDLRNEKFFNGLFWSEDECSILIPHKENGIYELCFTPTEISSFELNISSEKYSIGKSQVIHSYENGDKDCLIELNNVSFLNQDNTDTTILDCENRPIRGASVSCYSADGEIVAVSQSNELGEWNMLVRRGTYLFTFEKEGCISISFSRTVI